MTRIRYCLASSDTINVIHADGSSLECRAHTTAIQALIRRHVYAFNLQSRDASRFAPTRIRSQPPDVYSLSIKRATANWRLHRKIAGATRRDAVPRESRICIFQKRPTYFIVSGGAYQPEFSGPIANLTVTLGRDAIFTCHVKHLGGYRVSCVKKVNRARCVPYNEWALNFSGCHLIFERLSLEEKSYLYPIPPSWTFTMHQRLFYLIYRLLTVFC